MLQALLDQVKRAIFNDPTTPHQQGYDPSGLIGQIEGLFGQHQQQAQPGMNVRPASEDPLGDPGFGPGPAYGYLEGQNVRPASAQRVRTPSPTRSPPRTTRPPRVELFGIATLKGW
jgi:hypothetical protein